VISTQTAAQSLPPLRIDRAPCADTLPPPAMPSLNLDAVILSHVRYVLYLNQGNKLQTARQLGIGRSTLYRILGHS
jgi:transcriptional regulator of acetoin/glycerol metabolism